MDPADALLERYERGERPRVVLSHHALQRAVVMSEQLGDVSEDIRRAITDPTSIHRARKHGGVTLTAGRVAVGVRVSESDGAVIGCTVLWSSPKLWEAASRRGDDTGRGHRPGYDFRRPQRSDAATRWE